MASPALSEEERRLLREYRLTVIPSRRRQLPATTTNKPLEVTPDELNSMLELVSELNVSEKESGKTGDSCKDDTLATSKCKTYIFEKVDYIEKVKKLKRAKSKSQAVSKKKRNSCEILKH